MGIVKLSKSGHQVQFIADNGEIYTVSAILMMKTINEHKAGNFVVLTRLPVNVSPDRFPKSPVWTGTEVKHVEKASQDGLSKKGREERKNTKQFEDKAVW